MKIEQVSEHIWSLQAWLMIPVRVWVVADEEGVTLIDAGMPFMAKGILRFLDRLNAGPLQRILLTHGHSDHVGAVAAIRNAQHIPVHAHRIELPYMEGEIAYPRRRKRETNVEKGVAQPLTETEDGRLQPVAGLVPYLTPGHSPGHVVYFHEQDQVLLAGDLFTSRRGKLRPPMSLFTGDMAAAIRSAGIVKKLNPRRLEVCHGGPVFAPADQLDAYLHRHASQAQGGVDR